MTAATMTAEVTETTTRTATQHEAWTPTPEWFLAGKAEFTVSNGKGDHYSYQILKREDYKGRSNWLLTLLSGPDNNRDFLYVGMVGADGTLRSTRNSKVSTDSRSFKVAAWTLKRVWSGKVFPAGYEVNHRGYCGRCGRALTRPEGVSPKGYRFGYGETCYRTIMAERARVAEAKESVAPEPTAESRMNQAVTILEARMNRVDRVHPANRVETAAERFARANREAIEREDEIMGANPMY